MNEIEGKQVLAGQGEVLARECEKLFSCVAHCIYLIHIALCVHEDIS